MDELGTCPDCQSDDRDVYREPCVSRVFDEDPDSWPNVWHAIGSDQLTAAKAAGHPDQV